MGGIELLWNDGEFVLSRKVPGDGYPSVLLTAPTLAQPRPRTLRRLEHAYALRDELDPAWSARPLSLTQHEERLVLLLEDSGGEPLARLLGRPIELTWLLDVAIGLMGALTRLHQRGLVHRDLKPAHILVNTGSGRVTLTGFGVASRLPRERQAPEPPEVIAGTLAYMAPEQTGRMNRSVDSRSDLYAVGVTLYEMLTGVLPFTASDPLEWVHCHVARRPPSPSDRVADIPEPVSAIVMKLLAKTPEERYQTAAGVEADLQRCLGEWQSSGSIAPFPLGARDIPDRLQIPEKLYGREREIDALLAAFRQVVIDGTTQLVLVSGYSGIGKSSVVNELHKALLPPRGLFAAGKFDQYKRDVPYATLAQAFQAIIRQILSQPDDEVARWRAAIGEALGSNGRLLTNLVPELELVIGVQPEVAEVPPQDARRRFQSIMRRFLGVFARAEHPFVLFLDDLQWLDAATLEFVEKIVTDPEVGHLLLVGAYRDNEVGPTHPLSGALETIRQTGACVSEIVLTPLSSDDVNRLFADTLHCGTERARPLGDLVYEKTAGNPLFATQFLTTLADEGLLAFEPSTASWTCDLTRVRRKRLAENVADLMISKLNRLSPATLEPLKQLACLGSSASVATLTIALGLSADDIHAALWEAARAGLVFRFDGTYSFLHDRVREAAYTLIPEGERAAAHLRIGRSLAAGIPPDQREEAIFDVVNQLNRGTALITTYDEREKLAELNLIAGQRAKAASAYASALTHLSAGAALLREGAWERRQELAFALELHRSDCELWMGALPSAEERLAALAARAVDTVQRAAVARRRVDLYTMLGASDRAVEVGLEYLRHVGIDWPAHPTELEARREYERFWSQLGNRAIEELIDLPPMQDPESLATVDVLTVLGSPAIFTDGNLHTLATCRQANLSLERGNYDAAPMYYAAVGLIAADRFGDCDAGHRLAKMACDLAERRGLAPFAGKAHLVFALAVPWTRPVREAIEPLRRAVQMANEQGDLAYAANACNVLTSYLLVAGNPLEQVEREGQRGLEFARMVRFGSVTDMISWPLALVRTLRGETARFGVFDDGLFTERSFEERLTGHPTTQECFYWIRKLSARFLAGDYAAAVDAAERAERWLSTSASLSGFLLVEKAEYHLYAALSRAASCERSGPDPCANHREALAAHHRQLRAWAATCPENFEDRAALVGAEIARVEGRPLEAMDLYERAIRSARANGFVHHEALIHELAGRFYLQSGFETAGAAHLRHARACYALWGADGKVRQLDELYPYLGDAAGSPSLAPTINAPTADLDLATWVKTSEALSSEIMLDRLMHTLMSIAVQHAGAARGLLLLRRDGELRVEAEATTEADTVTVRVRSAPATSTVLPESILRYVFRTQESVTLGDASVDQQFATDPYIQRKKARSILCLPLVKQAKLIGVLYLENDLAPHVFTAARIALLKLVASQAAISLENARLYTDLQRSEAYLVQGQELSRTGTWAFDLLTGEVEWSEQIFRMFGRDPGHGKVTLSEVLAYVHPDDREDVDGVVERIRAEGGNIDHTGRILRNDGQLLFLRTVGTQVYEDGVVNRYFGTAIDVTEHELMTREIRGREAELRELVDLSPQALNVLSPDGMSCVYANQRACDQMGCNLEEMREAGWGRRVTHPDDLERIAGEFQEIVRGERSELEVRILCKDQGYRWFLSRYNALRDEQGQIVRWYVTSTDIEDRKRAEESIKRENLALREEVDKASMFEEIVGTSPALRAVLRGVAQVAPADSTVLITGETGTGKELVARAIHKRSPRASRTFVGVNCAAIPPTLIASELFGHEKGAFTGALQRRAGRFELADGGTIFLDEVGDLPLDTQLALLRVLQEREFERVGSTRPIKVDVRIIAATNRDLTAAIERHAFRPDLFYRLNVFPIEMPPLRERVSDIPMLVGYFVDRYARQAGKTIRRVDKQTLDLVKSYRWPGNVRELQNVIERAVIICDSDTLTVDPRWLARETAKPVRPLGDELAARERQMIETALAESRGRVAGPTGAAAKLGLNPSTLDYKIRTLRIEKHRFKRP